MSDLAALQTRIFFYLVKARNSRQSLNELIDELMDSISEDFFIQYQGEIIE